MGIKEEDDFSQWLFCEWLDGKRQHQLIDYSAIDYIEMLTRRPKTRLLVRDPPSKDIYEMSDFESYLKPLATREKGMLRDFFVLGLTYREIGIKNGLTESGALLAVERAFDLIRRTFDKRRNP